MMMKFDDVSDSVKRLATGCFLQGIGPLQLLNLAPPDALAFVANLGLDEQQYIDAVSWLGTYYVEHGMASRGAENLGASVMDRRGNDDARHF